MNPDQLHEIPEDVHKDQLRRELAERSASRDLDAEAEGLAKELKDKASEAAEKAVKDRVTVSVTPSGRVRRNGPCPCGSGLKFKKCCLRDVKDPEDEKQLPSPKAIRAYMRNQTPNEK